MGVLGREREGKKKTAGETGEIRGVSLVLEIPDREKKRGGGLGGFPASLLKRSGRRRTVTRAREGGDADTGLGRRVW